LARPPGRKFRVLVVGRADRQGAVLGVPILRREILTREVVELVVGVVFVAGVAGLIRVVGAEVPGRVIVGAGVLVRLVAGVGPAVPTHPGARCLSATPCRYPYRPRRSD
jgi:hypothetical protein